MREKAAGIFSGTPAHALRRHSPAWPSGRGPGRSGPSGRGEADYGLLLAGPWSEISSFECAAVKRSGNLATGIPIDPRYNLYSY